MHRIVTTMTAILRNSTSRHSLYVLYIRRVWIVSYLLRMWDVGLRLQRLGLRLCGVGCKTWNVGCGMWSRGTRCMCCTSADGVLCRT